MVLIIFTKGFTSFIHKFNYKTFITNYSESDLISGWSERHG